MDKRYRPPPAIEDLPQLYAYLMVYLEKLEGDIKQLQSASTRQRSVASPTVT